MQIGWHKILRYFLKLWCVAVCCSVLQCVTVCCSVLHCNGDALGRDTLPERERKKFLDVSVRFIALHRVSACYSVL